MLLATFHQPPTNLPPTFHQPSTNLPLRCVLLATRHARNQPLPPDDSELRAASAHEFVLDVLMAAVRGGAAALAEGLSPTPAAAS